MFFKKSNIFPVFFASWAILLAACSSLQIQQVPTEEKIASSDLPVLVIDAASANLYNKLFRAKNPDYKEALQAWNKVYTGFNKRLIEELKAQGETVRSHLLQTYTDLDEDFFTIISEKEPLPKAVIIFKFNHTSDSAQFSPDFILLSDYESNNKREIELKKSYRYEFAKNNRKFSEIIEEFVYEIRQIK